MDDYQDLVKRLVRFEDKVCVSSDLEVEAADALEHAAISHDMMVEQIETLTRERDELLKWKEDDSAAMRVFARYGELEAERDALRALLREAGEALEPFERFERLEWKGTMFENRSDDASVFHHRASGTDVTLGDFRRARAVLARIKEAVNGRE